MTRQQGDRGAARDQRQRDVNPGESRTDHQDARGAARTERRKRAGGPWIHNNLAAAGAGRQHRGESPFQRLGHAALGAPGRKHDGVGRQATSVLQRHAHRRAGRQADNFGVLDPYVGGGQLFLQVAAVRETRCEALERRDRPFVEPAAEMIGIVGPGGHPLRRNVQQMCRVVGAVRRPGARATRSVDQRDLCFGFAAAEVYRGEHARSATAHDRDTQHFGRLYLAGKHRYF